MVDLFCGAGGLSFGLKKEGFETVFAFDSDKYACETYAHNIDSHVFRADAMEVSPELVFAKSGVAPGELTLVCGGPPCQGFSIQRRGQRNDLRNGLVLIFAQLAVALAPQFILLENVPGLLGSRGREQLDATTRLFIKSGYNYSARVLDSADFGVPQNRQRAFIVAWKEHASDTFEFPDAITLGNSRKTVRQAISDLPEPPTDGSEHPEFANHRRVKISQINQVRIAHVPSGGGRIDLPPELQLPCHRKSNGHRHLDVFGRLEWDKPASTITAVFDNFTRGRFAHPSQDRCITAREGARLQGFPDNFRFFGPKKDVARQIGNAVPPPLAEQLGTAIRRTLSDEPNRFTQLSLMSALRNK
jgi:DNA (cytosine-5)-methyltransferase 1